MPYSFSPMAIYGNLCHRRQTTLAIWTGYAQLYAAGIPLGFVLGYARFPGRRFLRILVDTALSFPTVVLGLLVYLLLARQGPLADLELLFTVPGIAIGLALLGLPIIIAHACLAVEQTEWLCANTPLGAGRWQILFSTVRELRFHLLTACITAFGRVVSEVGISMLVGGNIKWATRTITTAITLETGKGDYARSIALGIVLVTLAFTLNYGACGLAPKDGAIMPAPLLHLQDITRVYPSRSGSRTVLDISHLDIHAESLASWGIMAVGSPRCCVFSPFWKHRMRALFLQANPLQWTISMSGVRSVFFFRRLSLVSFRPCQHCLWT